MTESKTVSFFVRTYRKQTKLFDFERTADRIVEAVDETFQLGTDSIEIDRRCDYNDIGRRKLPVTVFHVVMLDTPVLLIPVTYIAADTAAYLFADNRNLFNRIPRAARSLISHEKNPFNKSTCAPFF